MISVMVRGGYLGLNIAVWQKVDLKVTNTHRHKRVYNFFV